MPKIEASAIEKYQTLLAKDPNSQVFAPLAEAYREMGMMKEALQVVTSGVQRHPQFVGGLVTYAKILRDAGKLPQALETLKKATNLAPENILAHQLTAEVQLGSKNPKEALKAFKMVLFLNPNSKTAQKAVQKLESLTADEYDEEVFAMAKLPNVNLDAAPPERPQATSPAIPEPMYKPAPQPKNKAMERMLSLIDAFIVRNDLEKAHALLKDTRVEFGDHPEIERRMKTLQVRYNEPEEAMPLKPLRSREELIHQKKLETLEMMLRRIEEYRAQG
ncbi:tetratricopeptide repeat protein [Bdellovibrio svalbardensis]|uniref:Tetratricopeptide repeat protein n=1 Tax=Bdellovibrio svalbardensis TaxID=2972972 RepID=A0ABT6DHY3_9BACT|nr:tetratricopeptide repeat protein [Bdellovibrio svalbardensis]MDG0816092.1 tetratricopeptide repeat protein [Bdellovibrio svalbardensis]